jgi:hypothetical protein
MRTRCSVLGSAVPRILKDQPDRGIDVSRWSRWAPVTGVVSAVLGVAGSVISAMSNSPDPSAPGAAVVTFYTAHQSDQRLATILLAFAFIFLLFFAGSLRAYLRSTSAGESLSTIALAGAAVLLTGEALGSGLTYALTNSPSTLDPSAAQALSVLGAGMVLIPAAGFFVFGTSIGVAILRTTGLPKWLGWVAIAMGIVVVTPREGFSFLALVVWMVIVSILMYMRSVKFDGGLRAAAEAPQRPDSYRP